MADVLADRGTNALVVRGSDGLDEVTIFADTEVWDATRGGAVHPRQHSARGNWRV